MLKQSVDKVNANAVDNYAYSTEMLTADEQYISIDMVVQYRRTDPVKYSFEVVDEIQLARAKRGDLDALEQLYRLYADRLKEDGVVDDARVQDGEDAVNRALTEAYEEIHGSACPFPEDGYFENWEG